MPDLKIDAVRLRLRFAPATPDTLRPDDLGVAEPRGARGDTPVRLRLRFAPATPDTLRPDDLSVAAPRGARQGEAWWGKKDSNLRSHKTADLQSAPFATRDTPPFNPSQAHPPKRRRGRPSMTLKPEHPMGSRSARLWAKGDGKVNQRRRLELHFDKNRNRALDS